MGGGAAGVPPRSRVDDGRRAGLVGRHGDEAKDGVTQGGRRGRVTSHALGDHFLIRTSRVRCL
jgi:hypothetical protein